MVACYVLEGEGTVFIDGVGHPVNVGSVAHVAAVRERDSWSIGFTLLSYPVCRSGQISCPSASGGILHYR